MIGSRVRPPTPRAYIQTLAAAALALGTVAAAPAWAQQDQPAAEKPLRLVPPQLQRPAMQPSPPRAPAVGVPPTSAPSAVTTSPATPRPGTEAVGIEVDPLQTISSDAAGPLAEGEGGFGAALWEGTTRSLVDALLPQLPVKASSPTMRELMRRLLLSAAPPPQGDAAKGAFVALRARLLADMGDVGGVNDLLNVTPGRGDNDDLVRVETDIRFLTNDNHRACELAAGQIGRQENAYWQKAFIFCQALRGEHAKAALGIALLREVGEADPAFFALVDALGRGGGASIPTLADPSPLHLAMARAANAKLPADVIAANRPGTLRSVVLGRNAAEELRLEAAERAEAAGVLPVDSLRQLYTSVTFSEKDLASPLAKVETERGSVARALLYRTALVQTVPTAQAEAAARALTLARKDGRYLTAVRAFMPVLKRIPSTSELVWFAPEAIRALLAGGDPEAARVWFALLRGDALFNQDSAVAVAGLSVLARLVGFAEPGDRRRDDLSLWWESVGGHDGARELAARLYALFEGLGEPVPGPLWEALLDGPPRITVAMPQPGLWHRLGSAVEGKRLGETVLLSLLILGEGGAGQANPIVLQRLLGGLVAVGLPKEARQLAVEAAVAAGL